MDTNNTRIGDCIICNPTVKLEKGKECPVIDIDKITVGRKFVENKETVIYSGQGGAKFENGDTLMARITPCLENGKIAQARIEGKGIGSTELFVFRGKEGVTDNQYVYYFLKQQYIRNLAANSMTGASGRQRADLKFIKKIKLNLPTLDVQQRIASILSAYDNLIENNNKRIRLLEQMAENLYKEWFVRFRFPGHENAEFENGLPKGWVVKRMSDFCDVTDGTHDTPKPVDDGVPLITGKCISNGFIDYNEAYSISLEDHEKIKKRSGLSTGDILFSNIGTVGNCCIVDYDREFSVKNVIIFKPNDIIKTAYLYYWMMSDSMQNVFSTQTNGASQQFVGLTFMRRYKILVPEQRILFAFGEKINPLVEQKKKLHRINQNLSRQRDLLLPRLMSGKLEVKV